MIDHVISRTRHNVRVRCGGGFFSGERCHDMGSTGWRNYFSSASMMPPDRAVPNTPARFGPMA
jgi:hypothetical protein